MKKLLVAFVLSGLICLGIYGVRSVMATSGLPGSGVLYDSANTADTIVYRDSSGNFAATTITATTFTGTASAVADSAVTTAKIATHAVTTIKVLLSDFTASRLLCITTAKFLGQCSNVIDGGICGNCS